MQVLGVIYRVGHSNYQKNHEPELLFIHRLKLGFIHPPRLPGDVNRFFRSRTGRHRCSPDRFLDHFYAFRHRLHRVDTIFTATNVTT
jgi:hypothetical protein